MRVPTEVMARIPRRKPAGAANVSPNAKPRLKKQRNRDADGTFRSGMSFKPFEIGFRLLVSLFEIGEEFHHGGRGGGVGGIHQAEQRLQLLGESRPCLRGG